MATDKPLHSVRRGQGRAILLIHGLGGSWRSWTPVLDALAQERTVIAIDLPGHGETPAAPDSGTFAGLTDSVERYLDESGLRGVDVAGSSMGARLVLELARRGAVGHAVALDPGGFWKGWERSFFRTTIGLSGKLLRAIRPTLHAASRSAALRTALLAQLSAKPWALDPELVANELIGLTETPTFDALVRDLAHGSAQKGPAANAESRLVIGWGRQDRLCLPRQAKRAQAVFPSAELRWFEDCGHFPMWDQPGDTIATILAATR